MFCPFTPLTAPQKHNFTQAYQKFWSDVQFLRYRARWTGGQTEERKDSRTDGKSGLLKLVPHLIMHHSNWKFQNGLPHETGLEAALGALKNLPGNQLNKNLGLCLFIIIARKCSIFMGRIFCSSIVLVWTFNTRGVYNFIIKKANIPVNLVPFFNGVLFLLCCLSLK